MVYRARKDLPKYGIKKGDRVDRDHKARKAEPDAWISEGYEDHRRDEQDKQNARRAAAKKRWWQ